MFSLYLGICILSGICDANLVWILPKFVKQFRAPKPLPIFYNTSRETKVKLTSLISNSNLSLNWIETDDVSLMHEKFLLVIFSEMTMTTKNININQQIYFLTRSFEIYEKYNINGNIVKKKLGQYSNHIYYGECTRAQPIY